MVEVFNRIELVAQSDVSVLITGESGTGKESIPKIIHQNTSADLNKLQNYDHLS